MRRRGLAGLVVGPSAGDAYEALADQLPESGPRLPPDFVAWRDRAVGLLRTWNSVYFSELDPIILDGLRADAERVRGLIGTLPPRDLIEQVTNGISVEPGPGTWRIELTPQHHLRLTTTTARWSTAGASSIRRMRCPRRPKRRRRRSCGSRAA